MSARKPQPRVLAVVSQKGGAGKTSLCAGIAGGLVLRRKTVLLVDADPTPALSFWFSQREPDERATLVDVLGGSIPVARAIEETANAGLELLPGSARMSEWDRKPERFPVEMSRVFAQAPERFDYVIVDAPPSSGSIVRGLMAVLPGGRLVAAIQPRLLDLAAFHELQQLVTEMRVQNDVLHICGIAPTRCTRHKLTDEVLDALRSEHGRRVLPPIREAATVARAPFKKLPPQIASPNAPASADFHALTKALIALMED